MRRFLLTLLLSLAFLQLAHGQDVVTVDKGIYVVEYSQKFEQPLKVTYRATNRPKNADRGSMNFYTEGAYHTSDDKDYYRNVWDKGHMAPAAHFSDSKENIKTTFSYLNSALQDQYLNRGEWRLLEAQERVWDDEENLTIAITVDFKDGHEVLETGGHIPTSFLKSITWETSGKKKCFYFPNSRPEKGWEESEVECK
jgi:DNA/RNA endonuclease G (NUC1)